MTQLLTPAGYEQTKVKLMSLDRRLANLEARGDLSPLHRAETESDLES